MEFGELLDKIRNNRVDFESETLWTELGDIVSALAEQLEENRQALARLELNNFPISIEAEVVEGEAIEVIELPQPAKGETPEEVANAAFSKIPPQVWLGGGECYD